MPKVTASTGQWIGLASMRGITTGEFTRHSCRMLSGQTKLFFCIGAALQNMIYMAVPGQCDTVRRTAYTGRLPI